ncbi:MAG: MmpS family protein [Actinomycetota bacterium]|nr:MmpS family protein [Actinomycetota bacterium]
MTQQTPPAPGAQYQPPEDEVQAKKKRRRWPWVIVIAALIVIAAAITVTAVSGIGGDSTSADPVAPAAPGAPVAPAAPGAPVAPEAPAEQATGNGTVYEVIGEGDGTAMVTYSADENVNLVQEDGVALPWTKTVELGDGSIAGVASLTAQGDRSITSITCRVIRNDEVLSENTSTGQYAVVNCSRL